MRLIYKMSKWTDFVKKHYMQMKKTMKNVKLGDAMKKAAKEWKGQSKTKMSKRKTVSKRSRRSRRMKHGGDDLTDKPSVEIASP
jgi:hypothetical protein